MSWDDWKPDKKFDVVMNAMVVPEGTYEVCSRTINAIPNNPNSNAKWILNVLWRVRILKIFFVLEILRTMASSFIVSSVNI